MKNGKKYEVWWTRSSEVSTRVQSITMSSLYDEFTTYYKGQNYQALRSCSVPRTTEHKAEWIRLLVSILYMGVDHSRSTCWNIYCASGIAWKITINNPEVRFIHSLAKHGTASSHNSKAHPMHFWSAQIYALFRKCAQSSVKESPTLHCVRGTTRVRIMVIWYNFKLWCRIQMKVPRRVAKMRPSTWMAHHKRKTMWLLDDFFLDLEKRTKNQRKCTSFLAVKNIATSKASLSGACKLKIICNGFNFSGNVTGITAHDDVN